MTQSVSREDGSLYKDKKMEPFWWENLKDFRDKFTEEETRALVRLRKKWYADKDAGVSEEQLRLEFIRWLVEHGRLTEEVG